MKKRLQKIFLIGSIIILVPLLTQCKSSKSSNANNSDSIAIVEQNNVLFLTIDSTKKRGHLFSFSSKTNETIEVSSILDKTDSLKGFISRDSANNLQNLYIVNQT